VPKIPVIGFLFQVLGTVALALMLSSFRRKGPRPGVKDWSLGLWFLAASLLAAVAGLQAVGTQLRAPLRALEFVLAYWSFALVLLGTWCRWNRRELSGARPVLLVGLAVFGSVTSLAGPWWGIPARMTAYSLVATASHLAAGVLLMQGGAGRRRFGARVLGVSFLGQAIEDALFLVFAAGGRVPVPSSDHLVEAELLMLMLMGVGMISWLLEDESESAIALQQELHRKESLSAIGTLVAGVAHEARNPLFAISATVDALLPRAGSGKPASPQLLALQEHTTRLGRLMTDLLDYGRPIAGDLTPGPLCTVAAKAIASCADLSRQAGVTVELAGDPAPNLVDMDEDRLQQVFQNLLQNGIELTPPGGRVEVEVRTEARRGRAGVLCTVRDSGPGFDPAHLPQVFEPFFSRRKGGTGLGLSIVHRIVEQHAGDVEAANHPAGGGMVSVWLPAAAAAA